MADIEDAKPKEGQAVDTVTEATPHPADEDSTPGPYAGLSPDRPPVSTTQANVPIADSLVAGAGEGNQGQVGSEPGGPGRRGIRRGRAPSGTAAQVRIGIELTWWGRLAAAAPTT